MFPSARHTRRAPAFWTSCILDSRVWGVQRAGHSHCTICIPIVQSAYKRFHSIETALLKIHNDIIWNMDNGKVTALTLLDLSAAFDTIDHSTLLERLHVHLGISVQFFNGSNHTFQTDSNACT